MRSTPTTCRLAILKGDVEALIEMEGCAGAPGPQEKRQHEVTKLGFIISDRWPVLGRRERTKREWDLCWCHTWLSRKGALSLTWLDLVESLIDKHSWNNVERVRERGVGKCWSWYWLSGRVVCCPSVSADGSFYHSYSHDQLASIIASLCPQILSRQCHINSMIPMCW